MEKIKLLNTYINNVNMHQTLCKIEDLIVSGNKGYIVAVNVDVIVKMEQDPLLKEIVDYAHLVIADGMPLIWISKLFKRPIKAKISGSDLVPLLCELAAKKQYSIFIIGGGEGIAQKAKFNMEKKWPDLKVVGTYAPPFGFEYEDKELDKINNMINQVSPDLLIVCFGCPKQEKWIYDNYKKYNAKVSVCAGATVDFLAGTIKRAPKWMSNAGLEWLYRFLQEPKRMYKRYFIDDMKILDLIWKYRGWHTH